MGRLTGKKESEILWDRFQEERELFDKVFLEELADKRKVELEEFCFENFNPTEAATLLWQATITKAHRSPADFAEVASSGQWQRGAPHFEVLNDIFVDASYNQRFVIISLPVRHGKVISRDTKVPTANGFKKVDEITYDDEFFNERGELVPVTGIFPHKNIEFFEITFSNGDTIEAHGGHEWTVMSQRYRDNLWGNDKFHKRDIRQTWESDWWRETIPKAKPRATSKPSNNSVVTLTTNEIAEQINEGWSIPQTEPLNLPEKDLPLDPYALGYWLGDGSVNTPIFSVHEDDQASLISEFKKLGFGYRIDKNNSQTLHFTDKLSSAPSSLRAGLRAAKVFENKHVPEDYLWGSIEQRLALLQGLMDSDGGVETKHASRNYTGQASFTNTNKNLADAVYHLAVSLGEAPYRNERPSKIFQDGVARETGTTAYRVTWSPYRFNPFRLERKVNKLDMFVENHIGRGHRIIKSIKSVGFKDGACFSVDTPSHLYLAGEGMIPTHNTDLMSKWGPAWYLSKFPDRKIMQISYAARVVQTFSKEVRDIIEATSKDFFGLQLGIGSKAADRFGFQGKSGQLYATSVNGQAIGMGGDLIVVDDTYKDGIQAFSPTYNSKLRYWWSSTLRHRLAPGGSIVVVLARWSPKDLAGWLIEESQKIEDMEPWIEIKMPIICESEEDDILQRKVGEPLWPGRYSEEEINQLKASVGPLTWAAQFQQTPQGVGDSMFPADSWEFIEESDIPNLIHKVRYWDLSAGGSEADFVVGVLMGVDEHGRYFVLDVARDKFEGTSSDVEVKEFVRAVSKKDSKMDPYIRFYFEQTFGTGKAFGLTFKREVFAGLRVESHQKTGTKEANAFPFGSQVQGHNVYITYKTRMNRDSGELDSEALPEWAQPFIEELYVFPTAGVKDDQVDAASGAYQKLEELFFETKQSTEVRLINPTKIREVQTDRTFIDDILNPETEQEKKARLSKTRKPSVYRARNPRDKILDGNNRSKNRRRIVR